MTPLDAIYNEIAQLERIYSDPDLSYSTQSFQDECRGRADGLRMCLRIVEAARKALAEDPLEPLWRVRVKGEGTLIGVYRAKTAPEAIECARSEQHAMCLHFENDGKAFEAVSLEEKK